ncbi:alpha/beta hydrolase [Microbacterium paulum]
MVDCLPAPGGGLAIPVIALVLGLLGAGVILVVRSGRNRQRPGGRRGAAAALLLASIVVVSAVVAAPAPAHAAAGCAAIGDDVEITFVSGGVTYHGSYRGPAGSGRPVAAAVIVGGTGAVDRDGNGAGIEMAEYAWLAQLLADQGIATVRFDKLGTGATGLGPYDADPAALLSGSYDELRVQPVRDALAFLTAQPGIDASRLLLLGHSEGGAVAITVASDPGSAPAPAALMLIEPSYDRILDVVPRQLAVQMDAAVAASAMTPADAATLKAWMASGIDAIRSGTPPFPGPGPVPLPAATDFTAVMRATIAGNIFGSDPAQMVISHAYRTPYGKQFDEIDPAALAESLKIPVLVTCGTKDVNTPCGDGSAGSGVAWLSSRFAPGLAQFAELRGVVHILRDVGSAEVPNLADQVAYPFSSQLARELTAFVAPFRG